MSDGGTALARVREQLASAPGSCWREAPRREARRDFYDRSVHDVARDLIGCVVRHGETAGRIVEIESYHMDEPACHAFVGPHRRARALCSARPGSAYVYLSYGIHSLLNAVGEPEGVGAAVLIRALEPVDGIDVMRERRGLERAEELCSGPGKLTQALGIGLDAERQLTARRRARSSCSPAADGDRPEPRVVVGERVGITKAVELPWRFCDADSRTSRAPGRRACAASRADGLLARRGRSGARGRAVAGARPRPPVPAPPALLPGVGCCWVGGVPVSGAGVP